MNNVPLFQHQLSSSIIKHLAIASGYHILLNNPTGVYGDFRSYRFFAAFDQADAMSFNL